MPAPIFLVYDQRAGLSFQPQSLLGAVGSVPQVIYTGLRVLWRTETERKDGLRAVRALGYRVRLSHRAAQIRSRETAHVLNRDVVVIAIVEQVVGQRARPAPL